MVKRLRVQLGNPPVTEVHDRVIEHCFIEAVKQVPGHFSIGATKAGGVVQTFNTCKKTPSAGTPAESGGGVPPPDSDDSVKQSQKTTKVQKLFLGLEARVGEEIPLDKDKFTRLMETNRKSLSPYLCNWRTAGLLRTIHKDDARRSIKGVVFLKDPTVGLEKKAAPKLDPPAPTQTDAGVAPSSVPVSVPGAKKTSSSESKPDEKKTDGKVFVPNLVRIDLARAEEALYGAYRSAPAGTDVAKTVKAALLATIAAQRAGLDALEEELE